MSIEDQIAKLQSAYKVSSKKDEMYEELLEQYKVAQKRIQELEAELSAKTSSSLPTKDEVDTMTSMVELISKLDADTIEKLSKFSGNK
jgi:hypothetical protein